MRVRGDAGWKPVDTTLAATADGMVAPKAAVVDMAFSGRGTVPLARLRSGAMEMALRFPGKLPRPVLDRDTATYTEVLPGVDLTIRADVSGFSKLLVVKSAQAAANLALATLRFATSTSGLP